MLKDQIKYQLNFINCQHVIRFKVSEGCKTAKVTPIFKKGKKNTEPKKYKPVSLLLVMSKVIERVVHNQLTEHLENYKIIFDYQSGFRSKYSINTCLAHLSNQILKRFEARKWHDTH